MSLGAPAREILGNLFGGGGKEPLASRASSALCIRNDMAISAPHYLRRLAVSECCRRQPRRRDSRLQAASPPHRCVIGGGPSGSVPSRPAPSSAGEALATPPPRRWPAAYRVFPHSQCRLRSPRSLPIFSTSVSRRLGDIVRVCPRGGRCPARPWTRSNGASNLANAALSPRCGGTKAARIVSGSATLLHASSGRRCNKPRAMSLRLRSGRRSRFPNSPPAPAKAPLDRPMRPRPHALRRSCTRCREVAASGILS